MFPQLKNKLKMKKATLLFSTLSMVFLSLISMSSCETNKDIVATASEKSKTLAAAVKAAGLVETLQGTGPFTVFAPTDAAFAAIQSDVDNLMKPENKAQLAKLLSCHVVSGKLLSKDLKNGQTLTTIDGEKLNVSFMSDGKIMVGDAHVTTADIVATNGVIHAVDKVILSKMAEKMVPKMDIVAIASANAKTLAAAVTAAGLVETLQGAGPFTVFAPTDEAFAAIQKDVDKLLKPENKAKLSKVLTYHVVSGKMVAADLKDGQELVTVEGGKLKVSIKNGVVMVGNATVKMADVDASNGVVHVIDKVLMPKM
jgi:transforming growth factor-beta-induced protein